MEVRNLLALMLSCLCMQIYAEDYTSIVTAMVSNVSCRVVAADSEIAGALTLSAVPNESEAASVTVDKETVMNSLIEKTMLWRAKTTGNHTITHKVGGTALLARYYVTGVICYASTSCVPCRVIASNSKVGGELTIGTAPSGAASAIIFVDDVVITNTMLGTKVLWTALSKGQHTVRHMVGEDSLAATYDVTNLMFVSISSADGLRTFVIPNDWFAQYPTLGGSTVAEWQAVAENNGVKAIPVWQDYVAGTDPTNALSKFTAKIEMKNGEPVVTWSPALNGEGVREGTRIYRVWGKANLDDAAWSEVEAGGEGDFRFFRVTVEMP